MLKNMNQMQISFSKYNELYDILIEPDNIWREIKEKVDFSFVYNKLKECYSSNLGRTSEDVIRMFKYLLLKSFYKISDRELIRRTKTDLEFKYFLDYDVEESEWFIRRTVKDNSGNGIISRSNKKEHKNNNRFNAYIGEIWTTKSKGRIIKTSKGIKKNDIWRT